MTQMPQPLDGLRVLVVDDEADIREFITVVLESQGMSVKAVGSAAAAFEVLKSFQPNVLVCDIRMPGGSGYDLIRQIRKLEQRREGIFPPLRLRRIKMKTGRNLERLGLRHICTSSLNQTSGLK